MNDGTLGQSVNKANDLGKVLKGFILVGGEAKFSDRAAGGLGKIPVPEPLGVIGPYSFLC